MKVQIVGTVVDENKVNAPGVEMEECAAGQVGQVTDVMVKWEKPEKDMSAQENLRLIRVSLDSINSVR